MTAETPPNFDVINMSHASGGGGGYQVFFLHAGYQASAGYQYTM